MNTTNSIIYVILLLCFIASRPVCDASWVNYEGENEDDYIEVYSPEIEHISPDDHIPLSTFHIFSSSSMTFHAHIRCDNGHFDLNARQLPSGVKFSRSEDGSWLLFDGNIDQLKTGISSFVYVPRRKTDIMTKKQEDDRDTIYFHVWSNSNSGIVTSPSSPNVNAATTSTYEVSSIPALQQESIMKVVITSEENRSGEGVSTSKSASAPASASVSKSKSESENEATSTEMDEFELMYERILDVKMNRNSISKSTTKTEPVWRLYAPSSLKIPVGCEAHVPGLGIGHQVAESEDEETALTFESLIPALLIESGKYKSRFAVRLAIGRGVAHLPDTVNEHGRTVAGGSGQTLVVTGNITAIRWALNSVLYKTTHEGISDKLVVSIMKTVPQDDSLWDPDVEESSILTGVSAVNADGSAKPCMFYTDDDSYNHNYNSTAMAQNVVRISSMEPTSAFLNSGPTVVTLTIDDHNQALFYASTYQCELTTFRVRGPWIPTMSYSPVIWLGKSEKDKENGVNVNVRMRMACVIPTRVHPCVVRIKLIDKGKSGDSDVIVNNNNNNNNRNLDVTFHNHRPRLVNIRTTPDMLDAYATFGSPFEMHPRTQECSALFQNVAPSSMCTQLDAYTMIISGASLAPSTIMVLKEPGRRLTASPCIGTTCPPGIGGPIVVQPSYEHAPSTASSYTHSRPRPEPSFPSSAHDDTDSIDSNVNVAQKNGLGSEYESETESQSEIIMEDLDTTKASSDNTVVQLQSWIFFISGALATVVAFAAVKMLHGDKSSLKKSLRRRKTHRSRRSPSPAATMPTVLPKPGGQKGKGKNQNQANRRVRGRAWSEGSINGYDGPIDLSALVIQDQNGDDRDDLSVSEFDDPTSESSVSEKTEEKKEKTKEKEKEKEKQHEVEVEESKVKTQVKDDVTAMVGSPISKKTEEKKEKEREKEKEKEIPTTKDVSADQIHAQAQGTQAVAEEKKAKAKVKVKYENEGVFVPSSKPEPVSVVPQETSTRAVRRPRAQTQPVPHGHPSSRPRSPSPPASHRNINDEPPVQRPDARGLMRTEIAAEASKQPMDSRYGRLARASLPKLVSADSQEKRPPGPRLVTKSAGVDVDSSGNSPSRSRETGGEGKQSQPSTVSFIDIDMDDKDKKDLDQGSEKPAVQTANTNVDSNRIAHDRAHSEPTADSGPASAETRVILTIAPNPLSAAKRSEEAVNIVGPIWAYEIMKTRSGSGSSSGSGGGGTNKPVKQWKLRYCSLRFPGDMRYYPSTGEMFARKAPLGSVQMATVVNVGVPEPHDMSPHGLDSRYWPYLICLSTQKRKKSYFAARNAEEHGLWLRGIHEWLGLNQERKRIRAETGQPSESYASRTSKSSLSQASASPDTYDYVASTFPLTSYANVTTPQTAPIPPIAPTAPFTPVGQPQQYPHSHAQSTQSGHYTLPSIPMPMTSSSSQSMGGGGGRRSPGSGSFHLATRSGSGSGSDVARPPPGFSLPEPERHQSAQAQVPSHGRVGSDSAHSDGVSMYHNPVEQPEQQYRLFERFDFGSYIGSSSLEVDTLQGSIGTGTDARAPDIDIDENRDRNEDAAQAESTLRILGLEGPFS